MKREIQQIRTFFMNDDATEKNHVCRSSFSTVEKAIEDSIKYIRYQKTLGKRTVVSIEIINKETNKVIWNYKA